MKILHLGNVAGVPQTLAKYQRMLGHKSDVIMRSTFTVFGADEVADKPIVVSGRARKYALSILARAWKYDIIHAHIFPFSSKFIHPFYLWKSFVYHLHGTWIRGKWNLPEKSKYMDRGDFLAVSTPELLEGSPNGTEWIPNPVDTTHFIRTEEYIPNTALFILRWERQIPALEQAVRECDMFGLDLTILDRNTQSVPYPDFPAFLQKFEYYIDTKTYETFDPSLKDTKWDIPYSEVKMNPSLSLTALQQLAMGGKIVNDKNVLTKFPMVHEPNSVAERWIDIYEGLLK